MDAKREPQVINPPNLLQAKVPKIGGPSMANIVKVAEAELSKINANYEAIVQTDLRKINDAISRATGTPTSAADAIREISGISHDIKGPGGKPRLSVADRDSAVLMPFHFDQ